MITGGTSPRELLHQRREQEKELTKELLAYAFSAGTAQASQRYHLSESSIIKIAIKSAKRLGYDLSELISLERQKQVQEFIFEKQTSSIKKLVELAHGDFSEGELRLAKSRIQPQDFE